MKKLISSGINPNGVPWNEWKMVKDDDDVPKERVIKDDDYPKRKTYYRK